MHAADYASFTEALVESLGTDDRVIGLVALGSMAGADRAPDEWSDHDFWVVTRNGDADALRSGPQWLPHHDEVAVWFAETEHGRSAIYCDGHLVEYAVFDDAELEIARSNAFRVLIDHCRLQDRMRAMVELTDRESVAQDPTGTDRCGALFAQLTIGVSRHARGERLSAHQMIRGRAAQTLTSLIGAFVEPAVDGVLDSLDPNRRFETAYPQLSAEIDDALRADTLRCADALISLAERELAGRVPTVNADAVTAVRTTIGRAQVAVADRSESRLAPDTRS